MDNQIRVHIIKAFEGHRDRVIESISQTILMQDIEGKEAIAVPMWVYWNTGSSLVTVYWDLNKDIFTYIEYGGEKILIPKHLQ